MPQEKTGDTAPNTVDGIDGDVEMSPIDPASKEDSEPVKTEDIPIFVPSRGPPSTWQIFSSTMEFRTLVKKRKFKHNSGAFAQWAMGLSINFVLLLLTMVIRSRVGEPEIMREQVRERHSLANDLCVCAYWCFFNANNQPPPPRHNSSHHNLLSQSSSTTHPFTHNLHTHNTTPQSPQSTHSKFMNRMETVA